MEYKFNCTMYDKDLLKPQISRALQQKTEIQSRKKYPDIWAKKDALDMRDKVPVAISKKRFNRYQKYGLFYTVSGSILFVPSLTNPMSMLPPLLVGLLLIIFGVFHLKYFSDKEKENQYDRAANKLFNNLKDSTGTVLTFNEDGMSDSTGWVVPFEKFEFIFATNDAYALIINKSIMIVQKKDLADAENEDFWNFIVKTVNDDDLAIDLAF